MTYAKPEYVATSPLRAISSRADPSFSRTASAVSSYGDTEQSVVVLTEAETAEDCGLVTLKCWRCLVASPFVQPLSATIAPRTTEICSDWWLIKVALPAHEHSTENRVSISRATSRRSSIQCATDSQSQCQTFGLAKNKQRRRGAACQGIALSA